MPYKSCVRANSDDVTISGTIKYIRHKESRKKSLYTKTMEDGHKTLKGTRGVCAYKITRAYYVCLQNIKQRTDFSHSAITVNQCLESKMMPVSLPFLLNSRKVRLSTGMP